MDSAITERAEVSYSVFPKPLGHGHLIQRAVLSGVPSVDASALSPAVTTECMLSNYSINRVARRAHSGNRHPETVLRASGFQSVYWNNPSP